LVAVCGLDRIDTIITEHATADITRWYETHGVTLGLADRASGTA
jgi:hypothetical protein